MGNAFTKLFDARFGNQETRVVMLGLDAAGKTTILYKVKLGKIVTTVPTIGFGLETLRYRNVEFASWDPGHLRHLRPLWKHYFNNTDALIFVVDTADRDRIGIAAEEFQFTVEHPLLASSAILIFANKQDLPGACTTAEVTEAFQLHTLTGRPWHVQPCVANRGEGLYEGLHWLSTTLQSRRRAGVSTRVSSADA